MKHLSKINLHNLSQAELSKKEEALLKGGEYTYEAGTQPQCVCAIACPCLYEGEKEGPDDAYYGGASREDSSAANGNLSQSTGTHED